MPIFSDDVHGWAEHTYEVFVPATARDWLYRHTTELIEHETEAGEFLLTTRRGTGNVITAEYVPAREPKMVYDVPLNMLVEVMNAPTCEVAEDALTYAGEHPTLIDDFEPGSDDE